MRASLYCHATLMQLTVPIKTKSGKVDLRNEYIPSEVSIQPSMLG